jgi:hypothetical protein
MHSPEVSKHLQFAQINWQGRLREGVPGPPQTLVAEFCGQDLPEGQAGPRYR